MEHDPHAHRFLGSGVEAPEEQFQALSTRGSEGFKGIETFDNPGCVQVVYESDEVTLKCPVTGHPDFYTIQIILEDSPKLIESKSLKLYFSFIHEQAMRGEFDGMFCERFAVFLRDLIADATENDVGKVTVRMTQKSRGGIQIRAVA